MLRKLEELRSRGVHGFYYDSHARFLFCSRSQTRIDAFYDSLVETGLPEQRLVKLDV